MLGANLWVGVVVKNLIKEVVQLHLELKSDPWMWSRHCICILALPKGNKTGPGMNKLPEIIIGKPKGHCEMMSLRLNYNFWEMA